MTKIIRPNGLAEFQSIINDLQTTVVQLNTKLVIIDSIAAVVRKEGMNEKDRESFLITLV
jgi:RecA/RadA recombinase